MPLKYFDCPDGITRPIDDCLEHCPRPKGMKFTCSLCSMELPHLKALLDHYRENHPEVLKRFEIKNKRRRQTLIMYGLTGELLCEWMNWDTKDCVIKELKKG